jgi:hypothetical protein
VLPRLYPVPWLWVVVLADIMACLRISAVRSSSSTWSKESLYALRRVASLASLR